MARSVAGSQWGGTDLRQQQLCRGVWWFDSASHGGIVAVLGEADLPEAAVRAARRSGRVEEIAIWTNGDRSRISGPSGLFRRNPDEWRRFCERPDVAVREVWIAEEDCEADTILATSKEAYDGYLEYRYDEEEKRAPYRMQWPQERLLNAIRHRAERDGYQGDFLAAYENELRRSADATKS